MTLEFNDDVQKRLTAIGRQLGIEQNPREVVVRALSLFDIVLTDLKHGPVVITRDHELLQPVAFDKSS